MSWGIDIDASEIAKELRLLPQQIPFAMSVALNDVAAKSVAQLRGDLPKEMTLRNAFTLSGIVADMSRKTDLEAKVGALSTRWWMASQAAGDPARKDIRGKLSHVATEDGSTQTPTDVDGSPRPGHDKVIPRGLRIDRVMNAGKKAGIAYFVMPEGSAKRGVLYRAGPLQASQRKTMRGQPVAAMVRPAYPLARAYSVPDTVNVKPHWPLIQTVEAVVAREWEGAVERAVEKALWTAK